MPEQFVIETTLGNITIELFDDTPLHRDNFKKLVAEKYYDGITFHRVIPGFMIQGGDPLSRDQSRDGNPAKASSGSQFYINVADNDFLDSAQAGYTVFGKVISGMDVADKISLVKRDSRDNPIEPITMKITAKVA